MSQDEWITPRDAVNLLAPLVGRDISAKEIFAERLRDGQLSISCTYMTEGVDVGPIPIIALIDTDQASLVRNRDAEDIEIIEVDPGFPNISQKRFGSRIVLWESPRPPKRMDVGGSVFLFSHNWTKDCCRWDWGRGIFVFSRPPLIRSTKKLSGIHFKYTMSTRIVIYEVKFLMKDVTKLLSSFRLSQVGVIKKGVIDKDNRRTARKYDWTGLYLHLSAYIYVHGVNQNFENGFEQTGWQTALERWIERYFDDRGIDCSASQARTEAQRLIEAIQKEKNDSTLPTFG